MKEGKADGVLACTYRMNVYEPMRIKYRLVAVPTGETMGLSFALNAGDPELYALLSKMANLTPEEDMQYALSGYMYSTKKTTFMEFLEDNWIAVIGAVSVVFVLVIVLLVQKLKAERTASRQQQMLKEAAEVVKLKQTISSLLNNMPGMNYTKDAKTGAYLACNQAFASYARKRTPEELIGLTAAEVFDQKTAKRVAEDDKIALSMDEPYIFFEDVQDAGGERRQIKTTKLKYTDESGRLCVLGLSVDVTMDTVRIHRGEVSSREAYERARSTGIIYAHIAQALAQGYTDLYYINLDSEEYIEYRTDEDSGSLTEVRRGWHFFEQCVIETQQVVYAEDQEAVIRALDRKTLVAELERSGIFMMTYRLIGKPEPTYVSMRVTRMKDDERYLILGVTDVDEQVRDRAMAARMQEEQVSFARLRALAGDFLCIYLVDPESGSYREFSATAGFASFERPTEGQDFFGDSREQSKTALYPEDVHHFLSMMTREKVMKEVADHGIFTLSYRLMVDGRPRYVQLKVAMVEEQGGEKLIVGVNDIDTQVRQEEEYELRLARARKAANIDALTGVKNKNAYQEAESRLNLRIQAQEHPQFAVVILDVNDLKKVNDHQGHKAGDQLLRDACRIVCTTFAHSPVFRVGGDEFAVISQDSDYEHIDELVAKVQTHNLEAVHSGGIVIACGMARYQGEERVAQVFERADQTMYANKSELKSMKKLS